MSPSIHSSLLFQPLFQLIAQTAPATPQATPQQSIFQLVMMFGMIFIIFYFFMVRPQKRRQKQHEQFLAGLKKGDLVVTSAGIVGRLFGVTDKVVTLELGNGIKMRVLKGYISGTTDVDISETKNSA